MIRTFKVLSLLLSYPTEAIQEAAPECRGVIEAEGLVPPRFRPPLYALILHGWIGVFGDGEIAVRTPSLLFGLASLVVVYALLT